MTGRVVLLATSEQTLAGPPQGFLAQPSLARSTRRSYDQTLTRLVHELDGDRPLSALSGGGGHARRGRRVGRASTGDLEPARGHRPGAEAVAAMTAATDPARRRDLGLPE
jgi:hypothetical protein